MTSPKIGRPPIARAAIAGAIVLAGVGSLASTSFLTVAASGACLAFLIYLLWREDAPPILLMPAMFQWSEVAILPISTIWQQVPLNQLSVLGADLESSALYGLSGVGALAVGLRLGAGSPDGESLTVRLKADAFNWEYRQVAAMAFGLMAVGYACAIVSAVAGPARELFNQASNVKYIGLFAISYWCLIRKRRYKVLVGIIIFEVVFGITGFFADFKNSLLTFLVTALAARPRLRPVDLAVVTAAVALLLGVAVFWSTVKTDYRFFVNGGSGAQVVAVPLADRVGYMMTALGSIDRQGVGSGFNRLVARHGYIEYLGLTIENVPERVPHEDGALTAAVIQHIAFPRVLFPNKPALPSDTDVMARYTGLPNTWNADTSISIGHLGELYIDFGFGGGIAVMLAIGGLVGFVFRKLRKGRRTPALISSGLCLMAALPLAYFGTAYVKLVGAFVFSSAIALCCERFIIPPFVNKLWRRGGALSMRRG
jgi:hypothetical protein